MFRNVLIKIGNSCNELVPPFSKTVFLVFSEKFSQTFRKILHPLICKDYTF